LRTSITVSVAVDEVGDVDLTDMAKAKAGFTVAVESALGI